MWQFVRTLGPGLFLIALCSAILLVTTPTRTAGSVRRVAIDQYVSRTAMDDLCRGIVAALEHAGYRDGERIRLTRYNAEGDLSINALIAGEIVQKRYDLAFTITTPTLQAFAKANRDGRVPHVLGLVTDPFGCGIGLKKDDPSTQPAHMTGFGTMYPVAETVRHLMRMNPALKRIGTVWNSGEVNSEILTGFLKDACRDNNLEFVGATAESTAQVMEAVRSVLDRGAEVIYIGGDSTVQSCLESVVGEANKRCIPAVAVASEGMAAGALFVHGSDFYAVGMRMGEMGARILDGAAPSSMPIKDVFFSRMAFNKKVLCALRDRWIIPDDLLAQAAEYIDENGAVIRKQESAAAAPAAPARVRRLGLLYYSPGPDNDACIAGFRDGMARLGFVDGANLDLLVRHAQGDVANIPLTIDAFRAEGREAIITMSTPCLAGASARTRDVPICFTMVYDPFAVGLGPTAQDHRANVTGIASPPPVRETLDAMQAFIPGLQRVGIVYCSGEACMQSCLEEARPIFRERGVELMEVAVTAANEVLTATQALLRREPQAIWISGDNTVLQACDAVAKVARDAKLPVFGNDPDYLASGFALSIGFDWREAGRAAADPVAKVLAGTNPKDIPFRRMGVLRYAINLERLSALGMAIPKGWEARMEQFSGLSAIFGAPRKIAFITVDKQVLLDQAEAGVFAGLSSALLKEGTDYTVSRYNANGDIALLPSLIDAAKEGGCDSIITCGTPTLMAALARAGSTPVVFTVASKPDRLGLFAAGTTPANLAGVYDDPPLNELLDLATREEANLSRVATLYDPAQRNAQIAVELLRAACRERKLELIEKTCTRLTELPDSIEAAFAVKPGILVLSSDNIIGAGWPVIAAASRKARIPVYCTEPEFVGQGAKAAIGYDFRDWGMQTGALAARVLAGIRPDAVGLQAARTSPIRIDRAWRDQGTSPKP